MAHNILHGARHNDVHGIKHGTLTLGLNVTQDSTSRIYVPANATEWATVMTAAGMPTKAPFVCFQMQEPSGNCVDSVGNTSGNVGVGATYNSVVTGWTRTGIEYPDGSGSSVTCSTNIPDVGTTSALQITYAIVKNVGGSTRDISGFGITNGRIMAQITNAAGGLNLRGQMGAVNVGIGTAGNETGVVRPWINKLDQTNDTHTVYTNLDKVTVAFDATISGISWLLGRDLNTSANTCFIYHVGFKGADAEMTDAQIKTLLQTLGWSVAWS
jgi:hypothetical protein